MQNIYYIDNDFIKENSLQYILSIRYATDGLSFCIHDTERDKLLVFYFLPFHIECQDAVIAKVKQIMVEDELLHLKYQKVFLLCCHKEKMLIPEFAFDENTLPELYNLCFSTHKNDLFFHRKIKVAESYLIEALPRSFISFLNSRYPSICIVNQAYPFIIHALSNVSLNHYNLFIDIHYQYFDLLLTQEDHILTFNSFNHQSVHDIAYYALNCLQQCNVNTDQLQTICSGNFINESALTETLGKYIPHFSTQRDSFLSDIIKNNELNHSNFIHLLNIHRCE